MVNILTSSPDGIKYYCAVSVLRTERCGQDLRVLSLAKDGGGTLASSNRLF